MSGPTMSSQIRMAKCFWVSENAVNGEGLEKRYLVMAAAVHNSRACQEKFNHFPEFPFTNNVLMCNLAYFVFVCLFCGVEKIMIIAHGGVECGILLWMMEKQERKVITHTKWILVENLCNYASTNPKS